jgi:uroporphyrinogen-III synthase
MSLTASLSGLNVLVTRPQAQADGLVAAIDMAGANASHYPVMSINALSAEAGQPCKQLILSLDEFQHVIFISGNAVKFGMQSIDQYWPQLPIGISWYGIGKKTIEQLLNADVPVANQSGSNAMNSEALLEHQGLQAIKHEKVLILRGVGGREYLKQQLSQRGAIVNYAQCYQRKIPEHKSGELIEFIRHHKINAICINSGESLHNFEQLLGVDSVSTVQNIPLLVAGERVASIAAERGFKNITAAENASDSAMLKALHTI